MADYADLIARLREHITAQEWPTLQDKAADALEVQDRRIAELEKNRDGWMAEAQKQIREGFKQTARIAELEAALREAYEVYAGSDGFIPETAAEGYQQQLIKQMVDIIGAALAKENADIRAARAALEKKNDSI